MSVHLTLRATPCPVGSAGSFDTWIDSGVQGYDFMRDVLSILMPDPEAGDDAPFGHTRQWCYTTRAQVIRCVFKLVDEGLDDCPEMMKFLRQCTKHEVVKMENF